MYFAEIFEGTIDEMAERLTVQSAVHMSMAQVQLLGPVKDLHRSLVLKKREWLIVYRDLAAS